MKCSSIFALLCASLQLASAANGCDDDNCARAVTGTRRGSGFSSTAQSDCTSFMVVTAYGYTAYVVALSKVLSGRTLGLLFQYCDRHYTGKFYLKDGSHVRLGVLGNVAIRQCLLLL